MLRKPAISLPGRQLASVVTKSMVCVTLLSVSWSRIDIEHTRGTFTNTLPFILLIAVTVLIATCALAAEPSTPRTWRAVMARAVRPGMAALLVGVPLCVAYAHMRHADAPTLWLILAHGVTLVMLLEIGSRRLRATLANHDWVRSRTVVVGDETQLARITRALGPAGLERAGFCNAQTGECRSPMRLVGRVDLGLADLVRETRARQVLLADHWVIDDFHRIHPDVRRDLQLLHVGGSRFVPFSHFWEIETGRVDLDSGVQPGHYRPLSVRPLFAAAKRTVDIGVSLLLLVLTAPLLLAACIAIRLTSPGGALFFQRRIGFAGRSFTMIKLRTMTMDAESSGARWASRNDPRITPLGRALRSYRIDELPQLLNVLRGEMSIIGPRPERPTFVEHLAASEPLYMCRHLVKPGLTGWAQVNQGYTSSDEESREKLSYDLYYIKHAGIVLDILICLRTLGVILFKEGAR